MSNPIPPKQSLQQRREALQRANRIRKLRADDKAMIKQRQLDARSILADPPEHWGKAQVVDLLMAVPAVGVGKLEKIMKTAQVSDVKTVRGLTEDQRHRLIRMLDHFYEG